MRTQLKTFQLICVIGVAFCLGGFVGQQLEKAPHAEHYTAHELVQATCDISRVSDLVPEKDCADAQYKYKIEYLCGKADELKSMERHCWTEDNLDLEEY